MILLLPRLLLIDTCGTAGSIALANTGVSPAIVATATLPGRTASERLIPAIKALFADRAETLQSLNAIAIVHGPGSFTGIRIGLSAAKGLCEALNLPLIAISRLAVLAELAPAHLAPHPVHAILDAGRAEFYYSEYRDQTCLRESLLTRDEVLSAINRTPEERVVVACEPAVAESLAHVAPHLVPEPTAASALPLALRRISEGRFDDVATIDANYVRRTDAEIFAKPKPTTKPEQPEPTP
jgi:tRNA threonylcarbamoyladenosine biosynthesis protein TsaB